VLEIVDKYNKGDIDKIDAQNQIQQAMLQMRERH
jgi:hypothetical protein